jgi:ATP adenylyltransferase
MPGCFLCDKFQADRDEENLILKRGDHCAALMNLYPYNSGHLMVAPYRHVESVTTMNADERLEMMNLVADGMQALRQALNPDGFNVGINEGEPAGAGLKDHAHIHIVPRWSGDTNFMPVLGETKVLPQSLEETWAQLRDQFSSGN